MLANGQYTVQKLIRNNTLMGLAQFGQTGWDCIEFAQSTMQNADKIIAINCTGVDRQGWQGWKYNSLATIRKDEWLEEQSWQFHIVLKRYDNPVNESTVTTQDIATMLITWFNGPGCLEFRKVGVANLRIDPSSIIVYNDDSNIYQKRAVFTMRLQVPKEFEFGSVAADVLKPEIEPI